MGYPSRIICLTEETVETLYLLGRDDLIVGVSEYVERPPEAKKLPQVSQFIRSDFAGIEALKPDLVIGFSDLQKDIARELIGRGLNVLVTNQRSLSEILDQILFIGRLVGEESKAQKLVSGFEAKIQAIQKEVQKLPKRPRVYFEEWDHPRLSGIGWVSELIKLCGGENIFAHKSGSLAKDRAVSDEEILALNPEIIFGCWCGKKVKIPSIKSRPSYEQIFAVQKDFIWELPPEIFLQPGPALFVDGLDQMFALIKGVALDLKPDAPIIKA